MRRFLLQMTLLLVLGGWCTSVYAAWDLTNVVPITKPSELKDGMYVYFRGQCNASAAEMVLGADFSYTGSEVSEKHLFKLVDAGKSVNGYQMYYTQNVDNEKWFSGSTNGWTVDNMDESTPLAIAEASKWTCMEMKMPDNPAENGSYTLSQWYEAGGDEMLSDIDVFPNENKIQNWKWRSYEVNAAGGDALVLASFSEDFAENEELKGFFSLANVWGSAFGYTACWFNEGRTSINAWYAYEAIYREDPIGDLEGLMAIYRADNHQHYYRKGTNPGCLVDGTIYDTFEQKFQEVDDFLQGDDLDEARAATLRNELKAAYNALISAPLIPVTEGYYYIVSAMWQFGEKQKHEYVDVNGETVQVGKLMGMYDQENEVPYWNAANEKVTVGGAETVRMKRDGAYIFHITKSKTQPGAWDIRNTGTGRYMNGMDANSGKVLMTVLKPETPQQITQLEGRGSYVLGNYGVSGGNNYYSPMSHGGGSGTGSYLTAWNTSDPSTPWDFIAVTDIALIDSIAATLPQKAIESELKVEIKKAESAVSTGYLSLVSSAAQLSSNAADPSEGKDYGALIDGNANTFFHSSWHADADPQDYHYLEFKLPEAVDKVAVDWLKRTGNNANRPAKIIVKGQKEGSGEWTDAAVLPAEGDTLPWGAATPEYIKEVALSGGPYNALRFVITETRLANGVLCAKDSVSGTLNGYPNFSFAEFQLYNGWNQADSTFEYRASSLAYRTDLKDVYAHLSNELATAKQKVGKATQDDVNSLRAANEAFEATYPDTTILDDVLSKAKLYYAQAIPSGGDESIIGAYNTEDIHEALNTAVEEAESDYDKTTVTRAYINEHTAKVQAAINNFVADVNMPKMDTWYFMVNQYSGEDRVDNDPYGQLVYAGGKSLGDGIKWGGDQVTGESDPAYLWRFIDMGNNTFAVQNLGSGYYMGANRGTSQQYLLSDTAVAFRFAYVAGEQLTLEDANYNEEEKTFRYTHADGSGNIVTWEAFQNSPTSWNFVATNFDNFVPQMKVRPGGMDIYTFPYTIAANSVFEDFMGNPIQVYTLAATTCNEEGMITSLTLNPMDIPAEGVAAGTPVIIAHPNMDSEVDEDGNAIINLNIDVENGVSLEASTLNGVVGLLKTDTIKVEGCGYFAGDKTEIIAAKKNTVIGAQSGYINPSMIVDQEPVDGSITVGIKGDGVLNDIVEAVSDANKLVDVVTLDGVTIRKGVKKNTALKGLAKGIYIIDGKAVSVK